MLFSSIEACFLIDCIAEISICLILSKEFFSLDEIVWDVLSTIFLDMVSAWDLAEFNNSYSISW